MAQTGLDRKRYDDACGLAHALDLIGERWAMLVIRELAYGPRRFSELKADLPGISANVLTQRLAKLEQRGIVRKTRLPPPANVQVYEATEWGLEVAPVIGSLGKWAARSPLHDPTLPMSHVSVMMSLQTLLSPERAGDLDICVGFRFGETAYVARVRDGRLDVDRAEPADCRRDPRRRTVQYDHGRGRLGAGESFRDALSPSAPGGVRQTDG